MGLPDKGTPPAAAQKIKKANEALLKKVLNNDAPEPTQPSEMLTERPLVTPSQKVEEEIATEKAFLENNFFVIEFDFTDVQENELAYVFVLNNQRNFNVQLKSASGAMEFSLTFRAHEKESVLYVGRPMSFETLGCTFLLLIKNQE